ncbi:MAG: 16S rRNA (cytidine(1402)-2'-O)-methyltransferase [Desulfobacterales bacterium]|nr:MAG: 16S rRNA (cytidine(1402)-2'-O)-methyltransferase [Desulfobacterales bacterium]
MPSNLPTNESEGRHKVGKLYVVATPIGNKDDITLRALNVLREVDLIAAEDTRKTRRFLTRHNIKCSLISYHEHNEDKRTPKLINKLKSGVSIALVSNAGTPSVSDPGYRLIESAIIKNIKLVPIPGVSAATAALSVAGFPTDTFVFAGFLSKRKAKRLKQLNEVATEQRTIIFYESPKRILSLLKEIIATMGDRNGVLAREMTKLHEEFVRGLLSEIIEKLKKRSEIKGECTLLVSGRKEKKSISWEEVRKEIRSTLESNEEKVSEIARHLAKKYHLPKKKIYEEALRFREQNVRNLKTELPDL